MEKDSFITFGSQMGDTKAAEAVQPHLIELRRTLEKYCSKKYSPDIDELAPIGRIDGEIWYWEFEGCDKLRINRKKRYITIDIGMPRSRWEGVTPQEIRQYLFDNLKKALELMVNRVKKEKMTIDEEELFKDLKKVEQEFLNH